MASDPKMVALVLGKMRAGKSKEPDDGASEGERAAAEEILGAVKSGDVTALITALKSFCSMQSDSYAEPDSDEAA